MSTEQKPSQNPATGNETTDLADQAAEVNESGENEIVEPEEEAEEVDELTAMTQERDALSERLKRTTAEFQNFRKQIEKHRADDRRFTRCNLIRDLLPVVDGFDAAMAAAENGQDAEQVVIGVKMIHGMLQQFFGDNKVTAINPANEMFDPSNHEAVQTETTEDAAPGTILRVIQPGYSIGDLMVRTARVCVAAKPEVNSDETPDAKDED